MNILKTNSEAAEKKEQIDKIHNLIWETVGKINTLTDSLKAARRQHASYVIDAMEAGKAIDGKSKKQIRDIHEDIEDQQEILNGLVDRKRQLIQEYFVVEHKERMIRKKKLQKSYKEYDDKIGELQKEIKRLSDEVMMPISQEMQSINDSANTFEKRYFETECKLEDLIKSDSLIPFHPQIWLEGCKRARENKRDSIYVDREGNLQ